jgi:hypothetical protein
MGWACRAHGEMENAYSIVVVKPEGLDIDERIIFEINFK